MLGFFRGLFVMFEPGRIFSRLPGLIQVRENRVPASHLLRFVDVEPHLQWLVGAEGHRSWVVMSCPNNDSCNARGEKVYYVYCKLEHEAKQGHDCESSGRILTTWRQEAKTPIIVDSRLQFVQDPIVFIFVWTCKGDQEIGISRKFLAFWFSSCVVADAHPLPLLSQPHLSFQIVHCQGICQVFILCSTFNTFESSSDAAVVVGLSQLLIQLDGSRKIFQSFGAPSLAEVCPAAVVQGLCLSKCQKTTKSGNRRPAKSSNLKQNYRSALTCVQHRSLFYPKNPVQRRTSGEWHRHRQVKSFSWKGPDLFAQHLSLQSLENPLMLSSHCPVEIASVGSISGSHLKFPMRRTGEGRQVWAGHPQKEHWKL